MIKDPIKYDRLAKTAERVYKFFQPGKGFFSGYKEEGGRKRPTFNDYHGAVREMSLKLKRPLSGDEQTILAVALGCQEAPASSLTRQEKTEVFFDLWQGQPNTDKGCILYDRLIQML